MPGAKNIFFHAMVKLLGNLLMFLKSRAKWSCHSSYVKFMKMGRYTVTEKQDGNV